MPLCPVTRRWRNTQMIKICVCALLMLFLVGCVKLYNSEPSDYVINKPTIPSTYELSTTHYKESDARSSNPMVQTADNTLLSQTHSPILKTDDATDHVVLELRKTVAQLNKMERVFNVESYIELSSTEGLVIVVQVHNRIGYVRQLIESFKRARDMDKIFLIFSHDYYSKPINDLIKTISFCKVLQIFYPFSIELYPNTFPGQSKNDCPKEMSKQKAIRIGCNNALTPDKYGHYREAKYTAVKHHWWWKINTVFDRLLITHDYTGYVIFMEEDHYISPDFIHTALQLAKIHKKVCPDCDLINMGAYHKASSYSGISNKVTVEYFDSGIHNMAFGMDREFWSKLKRCATDFCTYDDYNWDWTLNSLGSKCFKKSWKVLKMVAARVSHIGACGGLHKHAVCNEVADGRMAQRHYAAQEQYLYPNSLVLDGTSIPHNRHRTMKPFGGWGDPRDHQLCLSFVTQT